MKRKKILALLWLVVPILAGLLMSVGPVESASFASASWKVVPTPNPSTSSMALRGVSAVSSSNVWAVGFYNGSTSGQTLIEHWNGTNWVVVPSPNPGTASNSLLAISALSSKDIWAVGLYANSAGNFQTLTEHWN